jgi:hypothetical protein
MGSVAKNLALLQNQWIPSQLGNLINIITDKRAHKGTLFQNLVIFAFLD